MTLADVGFEYSITIEIESRAVATSLDSF